MTFGQFLARVLKDRGFSYLDLAKATGIAPTNIQRMIAGTRPPPAEAKIALISVTLGMDKRSTQVLFFLAAHAMPEALVHLALTEREIPIEDFFSAALMRFIRVDPDRIAKPTWVRIVHKITQAREGAEREAALSVARDWPEITKEKP